VLYHGKLDINEHNRGGEIARPLKIFFVWTSIYSIGGFLLCKKNNALLTTKQLTTVAAMIAMAVLLKSILVIETGTFRFTFYDIPMMIIGIMFGPLVGGAAGVIVDFFHMMFSPFAFTFNVFTLSTVMWAVIPGLILFGNKLTRGKLILTVVIASVIAFSLNTIGIVQYQGLGQMLGTLPYRIGVLFIKLPIQVYFIEVLYNRVIIQNLHLLRQN